MPTKKVSVTSVALPTASEEAAAALAAEADELVCLDTPEPYFAVGYCYRDFSQVGDDEVRSLLDEASRIRGATPGLET
jgi:predicted phosphoribosyltransferase